MPLELSIREATAVAAPYRLFHRSLLAAFLIAAIAGCTASAGRDFARPASGTLVIGETTESEVLARYGKPESTGSTQRNGQSINTLVYSYASREEAVIGGIIPSRVLACHFHNRALVGYEFVSSYATDHTSFDPTTRAQVEVGRSTRQDVIALIGPPNGELSKPLVEPPAERALIYSYAHTQVSVGDWQADVHHGRTILYFLLDGNDVVVEMEYSQSHS